jgi:hypothetical protein
VSKLRIASIVVALSAAAASAAPASIYMRELDLMDPQSLVDVRQNCVLDHMPAVLAKVQRDNPNERLPTADAYCVRAVAVSAAHDELAHLYANLALQEQGYSALTFAEDAKLLQHDEAGRTTGATLRAALSGADSYVSITGKTRALPCPLALDAGYTWAYRNPEKPLPYSLTGAQAVAIARACYVPSTKTISVGTENLPAAKAGLIAGAWLGREQRQQAHTAGR